MLFVRVMPRCDKQLTLVVCTHHVAPLQIFAKYKKIRKWVDSVWQTINSMAPLLKKIYLPNRREKIRQLVDSVWQSLNFLPRSANEAPSCSNCVQWSNYKVSIQEKTNAKSLCVCNHSLKLGPLCNYNLHWRHLQSTTFEARHSLSDYWIICLLALVCV